MRALIVALLMVALALAGCSDGSQSTSEEDAFQEFDDDVEEGKGLIRGIVVDNTITPVANATVTIKKLNMSTETNPDGAFQFSDMEPGTYFLDVSKLGFDPVQTSADVVAGQKADIIRVQIARLAGFEPGYSPYVLDGLLGCSVRYFIEGRTCPGATLVWENHEFIQDIELDRVPTYVTSEMVWKSTQQLGGEMSFNLRRTDTNTDTIDVEGRSPLFLALNETTIALHGEGRKGGFGPDMPLRVIVFTAHLQETEPPVLFRWGVGAQIDQKFTVYTHIFHNYEPPADWRFTENSEVPTPE